jgi:hypothetical protein
MAEWMYRVSHILDLGTMWRCVVSSSSGHFTNRESAPDIRWTEDWVGP